MGNEETNSENNAYKALSEYFKLVSHPVRLKILEILRAESACVCHINSILDLRQAYVSQQLAVLREGGLIYHHKDGWNVYYSIADPSVYEIIDLAWKVVDPERKLEYDDLNVPDDCDCPRCKEKFSEDCS